MTALSVHPYMPIIACGSLQRYIKIFNTDGQQLGIVRYHDGFLHQNLGAISSLTCHNTRMLIAAGTTDSIVSVYTIT